MHLIEPTKSEDGKTTAGRYFPRGSVDIFTPEILSLTGNLDSFDVGNL